MGAGRGEQGGYCDSLITDDWASLVAQLVNNTPAMWETWVGSLSWEDSPEGEHGNPLQDSWLENPHGHWNLAGYSPWVAESRT